MQVRTMLGTTLGAALVTALAAQGIPATATQATAVQATAVRANAVEAPFAAGPDDPGRRWRVTTTRAGEPQLQWRAPTPIPVVDARVELRIDGAVAAYPVVSPDGRTVSVPLASVPAADLARAELWLSGRRLDAASQTPAAPRLPAAPLGPTVTAPAALGQPGPLDVDIVDYRRAALPEPGYRSPLEVVGHAVLPAGVPDAPLVLFLHGRHQACFGRGDDGSWPCAGQSKPVPSHLGYDYVQRMLASQGYATVSIAANAVNAQDSPLPDAGASARSSLVRHHLGLLADWTADPGRPAWTGRLDLDRVVLVGHSRGGEGVNQAAIETVAGAPYRLRGQVLLGATDFMYQTAGYLPTVSMLPYCDGDVFDLQGQRYVDAAATLTGNDPSLRSSVLVRGANHNYFNTEWTPRISQAPSFDDWGDQSHPVCGRRGSTTRLSAPEQRQVAKIYTQASVEAFLGARQRSVDVLDSGLPVLMPRAGDAIAWTHAIGGNRSTVRLGAGASALGAAGACRAGARNVGGFERAAPLCSVRLPYFRQLHWTPDSGRFATVGSAVAQAGLPRHLRFAWASPGVRGGLALRSPLDLRGARTVLDLRVIADPRQGRQRFAVRLTDADGTQWDAPATTLRRLPGEAFLTALWAQTVRIDPSAAPVGFDRSAIDSIELTGISEAGSVWVLDASARRTGLAVVPATLLPSIRLRDARVQEGDSPRRRTMRVPFTVQGDLVGPARVALAIEQHTFGPPVRDQFRVLRLDPGQTSGFVTVPYEADTLDDDPQQAQYVYAVPLRGIGLSGGPRRAVVIDDDPPVPLRLTARRSPVRYGQAMHFDVTAAEESERFVFVAMRGVRTPGVRPLRVQDVPERWLRDQLGEVPPGPLFGRLRFLSAFLEPGQLRSTFTVPLRPLRGPAVVRALSLRARGAALIGPREVTIRVRE